MKKMFVYFFVCIYTCKHILKNTYILYKPVYWNVVDHLSKSLFVPECQINKHCKNYLLLHFLRASILKHYVIYIFERSIQFQIFSFNEFF